jgi:hypothetical protein
MTNMKEAMMKKRSGIIAAVAAGALAITGFAIPAHAANRVITVWADDQRGPQLTKSIDGKTTIAPGYTIKVKYFSAL